MILYKSKIILLIVTVKANNPEALMTFEALLQSDVENEGVMFKRAEVLNYDDTCAYFKSIYGG